MFDSVCQPGLLLLLLLQWVEQLQQHTEPRTKDGDSYFWGSGEHSV